MVSLPKLSIIRSRGRHDGEPEIPERCGTFEGLLDCTRRHRLDIILSDFFALNVNIHGSRLLQTFRCRQDRL